MKTSSRLLALLLLLLVAPVRAESDESARELRRRFRRDFAPEKALDIRQRAIETLVASGRPEGVTLLIEAVAASRLRLRTLVASWRSERIVFYRKKYGSNL